MAKPSYFAFLDHGQEIVISSDGCEHPHWICSPCATTSLVVEKGPQTNEDVRTSSLVCGPCSTKLTSQLKGLRYFTYSVVKIHNSQHTETWNDKGANQFYHWSKRYVVISPN